MERRGFLRVLDAGPIVHPRRPLVRPSRPVVTAIRSPPKGASITLMRSGRPIPEPPPGRMDEAWDITRRVFSYTNHTVLPEALAGGPLPQRPACHRLHERLKDGADDFVPRTVIFAGKAAPSYTMAKLVIRRR